jgi:hypothetical protein
VWLPSQHVGKLLVDVCLSTFKILQLGHVG